MDKNSSRDVAFFSILETAVNLNLTDEKSNFKVLLNDLAEKIGMDLVVIKNNIKSLETFGLLKIKEVQDDYLIIDFSNYQIKLAEVFSSDEIEKILKEFDYFIKKYDELIVTNDKIQRYVSMTKEIIKTDNEEELNHIIKAGLNEIFDETTTIIMEKKLYNLCEYVDESDLKIIEVILFCLNNFKKSENPFFVTLFLASIYKNIG